MLAKWAYRRQWKRVLIKSIGRVQTHTFTSHTRAPFALLCCSYAFDHFKDFPTTTHNRANANNASASKNALCKQQTQSLKSRQQGLGLNRMVVPCAGSKQEMQYILTATAPLRLPDCVSHTFGFPFSSSPQPTTPNQSVTHSSMKFKCVTLRRSLQIAHKTWLSLTCFLCICWFRTIC